MVTCHIELYLPYLLCLIVIACNIIAGRVGIKSALDFSMRNEDTVFLRGVPLCRRPRPGGPEPVFVRKQDGGLSSEQLTTTDQSLLGLCEC
jgi:hypothetical protein